MTPYEVLLVAWARKPLILSCIALFGLITLAVSMVLPRTYKASAEVLIDLRAPDPVQGTAPSQAAISGYVATQVDIIGSARVARRVVQTLRLADNPVFVDEWKKRAPGAESINWIADRLLKELEVRPSKEGNMVRLMYTSTHREMAATIVNGFADAYLETVLQLKVEPARMNSRFFDERLYAARAEVEHAQRALSVFQRENNLLAADDKSDIDSARLAEMSTQLLALQQALTENQARQLAIGRNVDSMPEVLSSPLVQSLKGEIAKLEAKLQDGASKLGTSHPEYLGMREELASLREKQALEIRRYAVALSTGGVANVQREKQLRTALEQQRQKVLRNRQLRDEMGLLQKDADNAQRSYDQIALRQNQTTMESLNRQTNVAVLTPAVVPNEVASPKVALNTIFGALAGLLAGLAIALVLESRNRRTRVITDLTRSLKLPVLVVVPDARSRRRASMLPHQPPLSTSREVM